MPVLGGDDDLSQLKDTDSIAVDTLVSDEAYPDTATYGGIIEGIEAEQKKQKLQTPSKKAQCISENRKSNSAPTASDSVYFVYFGGTRKISKKEYTKMEEEAKRMETKGDFTPEYTGGN